MRFMWLTDRFKRKPIFSRVLGAMLQHGVLLLVLVLALTCRTGRAGKFWHITDLHLDRDYVVGGNVKDMCHRYL
jgi:hypothetical protein